MNRLAFLIFCFFSIHCRQAAFAENICEKQHGTQNTKSQLVSEAAHSYSLSQLLENISPVYHSSIVEAIAKMTTNEDTSKIVFTLMLGGLSNAQLFQMNVDNRKYVLRLLDEKKAVERRKSEVYGHLLGASLKIAPKLIYTDQIPLVMVMEFIEGRTFSHSDLNGRYCQKLCL